MRNTPLKKAIPTRASSRLRKNLVDGKETDAVESIKSPKKEEKLPILEAGNDNETSIPNEDEHKKAETIELKSTSSEEEQDEEEPKSDMTDNGEEAKNEIENIAESDVEEVQEDDEERIEEDDEEDDEEGDEEENEENEEDDEEDNKEDNEEGDEEMEEGDSETEEVEGLKEEMEEEDNNKIVEEEQIKDSGSDSDEAPEGISLKESRKKAQQKEQDIVEANKLLKLQKKQLVQDRQLKNRKQQERANKDKISANKKNKSKDDGDKTNDDYIDTILSQVNKEKTVIKTQPKNKKITFDEDFEFDDDDIDEGIEADSNVIQAKHLYSVNKIKDIGADAREFLQEHFYGSRLRREGTKKSKYSKKNLKLISKRPIEKRSKPY